MVMAGKDTFELLMDLISCAQVCWQCIPILAHECLGRLNGPFCFARASLFQAKGIGNKPAEDIALLGPFLSHHCDIPFFFARYKGDEAIFVRIETDSTDASTRGACVVARI